ncbi:hypothetical protein J2S78_003007 [Salibacterium salarium]|uniref:hypothetical protein n=1 Tax=Salibacterium salarium TaxID=284579 RepID=UPI0027847E38|nr:hypothetical protein [Salibacterium salarium]MDQ0300539.1 hypothetical protein [Salibacterium salarium]
MKSSEPNMELGTVTMNVDVEELEDQRNEEVNFIVEDLDKIKISLSDENINDIKKFYDRVFEYIISEKKLIEFQLRCEKNNLYSEVASDIIDHLNNEIKQSQENFEQIISLASDKE